MRINFSGPCNNLGYGQASKYILAELVKAGHDMSYFPIGQIQAEPQFHDIIRGSIERAQFFDQQAPSIRLWHQFDMAPSVGRGKRIGFPIFELDQFTPAEKHQLGTLDQLFVCSEWAKQVVVNNNILDDDTVHVVPLGVDTGVFYPAKNTSNKTRFLTCGKWEQRKNHDGIIQAFNRAFTEHDQVELIMHTHNPFLTQAQTEQWTNLCKHSKMAHAITLLGPVESQQHIADLMRSCDCGIFMSRAEGWGLPILEMLACGKQVISTYNTGMTEFLTTDNAILLDTPELEPAWDGLWFKGQGSWHTVDERHIEQAAATMRLVHKTKQDGSLLQNDAGIATAARFTWANSARQLITALERS